MPQGALEALKRADRPETANGGTVQAGHALLIGSGMGPDFQSGRILASAYTGGKGRTGGGEMPPTEAI